MIIEERSIGDGRPVYVIAELSANHRQNFDNAVALIHAAKDAGADAIKLQTYTAETMTIDGEGPQFVCRGGTPWDGRTLHELYEEAHTPWPWQPDLKAVAQEVGLTLFSTPFDPTAVDFLEAMDVPAYKIASFELIDLPLIERVAATGKPIIMSTGMASLGEIEEAVATARRAGATQIALLKCTSAYPSPPDEANLRTIPHLAETFGVLAGLSDHTLGIAVPVAAVALGACIVEKHFTLSRKQPGPDSTFSLEPGEFKRMTDAIRTAERALGRVTYEVTASQKAGRAFRRSLYAVVDIAAGDVFTKANVRSIRPAGGLPPRELPALLGRQARGDIPRGTPLDWEHI